MPKNIFKKMEEKIKPATVAGQFYPASKIELENTINSFLNNVQKEVLNEKIEIKALISPHAGYAFSGQVAAFGYKQLENNFDNIFILADNHNSESLYSGISIPTDFTHFQTPIGNIKISNTIRSFLKNNLFKNIPSAYNSHIIEVQLPFLQKILTHFKITPMILSGLNENQQTKLAELISQQLNSNDLIIVSSDLSHFHPYDKAVMLDKTCIKAITNGDVEEIKNCEVCGPNSILTLMKIAKQKKWKIKLLNYKNSGDIIEEKNSVVGYSSIIFYQEKELNKNEQKILLNLARKNIESRVKKNKPFEPDLNLISQYPKLLEKKGTFVTLSKNKTLRGCIGNILPQEELYLSVQNSAINAAMNDLRFLPVEENELNEINIEISVLEIPQLIEVNYWQEYLKQLTPLQDGIIIKLGSKQATYLPQVWEQIPEKENFLNSLCQKAGLDYECWKNPKIEIYKYQIQSFKE
ncbi:MAG: AmmeMemoRadiSam system protein B [Patescibacteria group bacterium]